MAVMADTRNKQATKVITLGCRLNAYESDVIAQNARDVEDTGAVVINTCAVTNDAVAESRRQVRKAKRDNPDARIIVTGCAAQINPTMFADMDEVDHVAAPFCKFKMDATIAAHFALSHMAVETRVLCPQVRLCAPSNPSSGKAIMKLS